MPHFSLGEFKLYYEDHGQGNPLLLIAGLNCDSRLWTLVLDDLKKHFRVIFFDNRGVGKSDGIDAPITIEIMANDAFKLLNHLGIERASVMGHSMGGTIAQTMAYLQPHRVHKLVICNSLVKVSRVNKMLGSIMILLRHYGLNHHRIMKRALPFLFSKQFRKNKLKIAEVTKGFLEENRHPQEPTTYKKQLEALFSFNSLKWLSQIKSLTLIIEGHEDRLCPHDSKILAKHILNSTLVSLPNVGHVPMIEQPHTFVQVLSKFFELSYSASKHSSFSETLTFL